MLRNEGLGIARDVTIDLATSGNLRILKIDNEKGLSAKELSPGAAIKVSVPVATDRVSSSASLMVKAQAGSVRIAKTVTYAGCCGAATAASAATHPYIETNTVATVPTRKILRGRESEPKDRAVYGYVLFPLGVKAGDHRALAACEAFRTITDDDEKTRMGVKPSKHAMISWLVTDDVPRADIDSSAV